MKYKVYSLCIVLSMLLSTNSVFADATNVAQNQPAATTQAQTPAPNDPNAPATDPNAPVPPVVSKEDEEIKKAVSTLMGLGIVNGKEDGQFHETENITREEFVKMIIEVLGIEDEMNLIKKESTFEDIEEGRWSAGYIQLGVNLGIVKGYNDNLFKPTEPVTFEQGITILLRGMGYKDEYLEGKWPLNYVLKGTQKGILNGVKVTSNSPLTRGNAAMMIYNAFDTKYIDGVGDSKVESTKNFLEGKLNIYKLEKMKLIEKDDSNGKKTGKFRFGEDTRYNEQKFEKEEEKIFTIKEGIKTDFYQGVEYILYMDGNEKVLYAQEEKENAGLHKIQSITNGYTERPEGKIQLSYSDDYIKIDDKSEIYVNGEKISKEKYEKYLTSEAIGDFIVEDEKLIYGNIILCDYKNFLVKEVDANKQSLKGVLTEDGTEEEINFSNFKKYKIYSIEGSNVRNMALLEIMKDHMISVSEEIGDGEERIIYVWKDTLAGRVQKVFGGANNSDIYFTLQNDTNKYYLAEEFSYRYNQNKDIDVSRNKSYAGKAAMEEFYNEQVNMYKDLTGKVVYIEGNFNSNTDLYGILMKFGDEIRGEIQIFTKTGSKTVYAFENPDEYLRLKKYANAGCILKYSLGKSGKLKDLSSDVRMDIFDENKLGTISAGDDFGEDFAEIDGRKLYVDNETIYFDYTDNNPNNVKSMNWNRFKNKKVVDDVSVVTLEDGDKLKLLIIRKNLEGIQEEVTAGYVQGTYNLGDKKYVIIGNSFGEINEYKLDDASKNMYLDNRLVFYKLNTDTTLKVEENEDFQFRVGKIEKKSGRVITVDGEEYIFDGDHMVYNQDEKEVYTNLKKGDLVAFYEGQGVIKAARVFDFGKYTKAGEGTISDIDVDSEKISIEMEDETKDFYVVGETDYITPNGYLQMDKKSALLLEAFEEYVGKENKKVKFIYNKETDDIYLIRIEE